MNQWPIPDEGCISAKAERVNVPEAYNVTEAITGLRNRVIDLECKEAATKRAIRNLCIAGFCICAAIIIGAFR